MNKNSCDKVDSDGRYYCSIGERINDVSGKYYEPCNSFISCFIVCAQCFKKAGEMFLPTPFCYVLNIKNYHPSCCHQAKGQRAPAIQPCQFTTIPHQCMYSPQSSSGISQV